MTGATQWRVDCPCREAHGIPDPSMFSQVSGRNLPYFISEGRVPSEVDEAHLERWHERATEIDGALLACNYCRRVVIVDGADREWLAGPEPRGGALA